MGMHRHPEYGAEVDELYWKWKQREAADEALGGIKEGLEETLGALTSRYAAKNPPVDDGGKIELVGKIIVMVEAEQKKLHWEQSGIERRAEALIAGQNATKRGDFRPQSGSASPPESARLLQESNISRALLPGGKSDKKKAKARPGKKSR